MQRENISTVWCARVYEVTILATIFGFLFSTAIYAQSETETVDFDIPSLALPQALNEFARQARVELVFAERGFDSVQTKAVIGSFEKERALELLLAGTGLRVGYGSGDSVIVQRADTSVSEGVTSLAVGDSNSGTVLLAQAAVDTSQGSGDLEGVDYQSGRVGDKNDSTDKSPRFEEIRVTGSRILGAQNASPIITITREEIDRAGLATVEEIVERLPQNFGAGASADTSTDSATNRNNVVGGVVDDRGGKASVNLRGLGVGSTLVLLNGRRLGPSGRSAQYSNISSIPVTAIERVEVMTDGASAIYGSDAIGGVVNFILRDSYDGAETRLRYGVSKGGDRPEFLFGQSYGKSWDDGNVLVTYEYFDAENLASRDRDITASNDLTQFGGTDYRTPGGNPANIVAGGQVFAIPAGQDGSSLTATDFDPSTPLNFYNNRAFTDVMPELERHSAFLHLTQAIGSLELFGSVRFSTQETRSLSHHLPVDLTVTDSNPFFVDPTGTGLTSVTIDNYSLNEDFGPIVILGGNDSLGAEFGTRFDIGSSWSGELLGSWSQEESDGGSGTFTDLAALNAALNPINPGDPVFNPFGDGSNTDSAILETVFGQLLDSRDDTNPSENELWQLNFNINGSAFDIAGGAVQVAVGTEFREESLLVGIPGVANRIDLNREIVAAYAEMFFPLVSNSNSRPGLQRLEFSVAARYEDYSDFGDTVNPKVGLVWSPTQSLVLKGTWGTSFKAPGLKSLQSSDGLVFYFPEIPWVIPFGLIDFPFIVETGGNENLRPEEATSWTAGVQWSPERVKGLSLDITYFDIDFEDRIGIPTNSPFEGVNDPRFASILNTSPTQEQINSLANDENYFAIFGVPAADLLSGAAPVGGILDLRTTNLARSVVSGVELRLSHGFETAQGSMITTGLSGTYMLDFKRQFIESDPLVDEVDTYGRPVDLRLNGNVTWVRGGWAVSGLVYYIDGYTDNTNNISAQEIDSWTTADMTVSYKTGDNNGFLGGTQLSLTIKNLFDSDPPFVNTLGGLAYDSANGNPLGRTLSLQATKVW